MAIGQNDADQLFYQMEYDREIISREEKLHGSCIRLYQNQNVNRWLFADGYVLETNKH